VLIQATIQNISAEKYSNLQVPSPPLAEQRAIAAFLDCETARIDALVEKQERLIELLQEKRAALITHAVTKGLNPDAPMKDSGVPWLGEIPAHWEVRRLKHAIHCVRQKLTGKPEGLPYLGLELIESWTGRLLAIREHQQNVESTVSLFYMGDVLFGKLRPYLAKAWLAESDGAASTELLVLRATPVLNHKYLLYGVLCEPFIRLVDSFTYGTKMPRTSWDQIGTIAFPLPPLPEQRAIAAFLDHETARIDDLIEKIRMAIERLREYRTALITAAVTGKIDVRQEVHK